MAEATFAEMARALHDLGFSEADIVNAELAAHDFKRHGFSEDAARLSIERMRQRALVIDQARALLVRAARWEVLIRELTQQDPPRWATIWRLVSAVIGERVSNV